MVPLPSELDNLLALNPVSFKWISDGPNATTTHYGFIAQDVQKIFPDLVMKGQDGYLALNYAGFAPYIVSAMQQMQNEINGKTVIVAQVKRSAEENWQDIFIGFLILGFAYQQYQIRRLKK